MKFIVVFFLYSPPIVSKIPYVVHMCVCMQTHVHIYSCRGIYEGNRAGGSASGQVVFKKLGVGLERLEESASACPW